MADAQFWNRVLLLDFDGTDGATSATDASRFAHTLTFNGDAQLDTANKKFGTASLLLDGTGDYVTISDANHGEEFELLADANAIEFWFMKNTAPGGDFTFISKWDEGTNDRSWRVNFDSSNNRISYDLSTLGTVVTDAAHFDFDTDAAGAIDLFDGAWHHIVCYRLISGVMYVGVDGNVGTLNSFAQLGPYDYQSTVPVAIGCDFTSGTAQNLCTGAIDSLRITVGYEEYTAVTGTFTAPSAAFDTVDGGEGAAYTYPLSVNIFNAGAETGRYPWVTRYSSNEHAMSIILAASGGPTPQAGTYSFSAVPSTAARGPANATSGGWGSLTVDMTRYDSQFLDDIDLGILDATFSGYSYIENAGDGQTMLTLDFYNESNTLLASMDGSAFVPTTPATWEQDSITCNVPASTRYITISASASKGANLYADCKVFLDTFALSIDQKADYLTDVHTVSHFQDAAGIIANWTGTGTLTEDDNSSDTDSWMGPVVMDSVGSGTDVDAYSPTITLASDATDIDAASVDFVLTAFMANFVDTCQLWVDFYEADGTTAVGTRQASTLETHAEIGELVTVTGTIPTGALKAKVGFFTSNASSGADFNGRNVLFQENGPAPSGGGGGGGGGSSMAIAIGMMIGAD